MTASAPLVFPGSRTLAGWWRQLTAWQPRTWWVGHILLHRVEALAELAPLSPLDPLHRLVLHALRFSPTISTERLDDRLHLGRQLLGRLLRALQSDGLVSAAGDEWSATERGRQAQDRGEYQRIAHERRSFSFVESELPGRPPHFLHLDVAHGSAWSAGEGWHFDSTLLGASVARPEEWKRRFGFPIDVQRIVTLDTEASAPTWQRVVVDRPERLAAVVVRSEDGRLVGFAVRQDNWGLQAEAPLFSIDREGAEVFPQLSEGLSADQWQQAWQAWCQPRSLAGLGVENCGIGQEGHRLRVTVPPRLLERLRATRSDALKGEAWLLGGSGRLRAAALLEIAEEGPSTTLRQA
jgi:hypothetical protein